MEEKRPWLTRNVFILGGVSLLNDAASEMIYPLLPIFLTSVLGAGPQALGLIEGVAEATASWLKLAVGIWSDRWRHRKIWIVSGYLVSNVMRPCMALARTWPAVLVLRFFDRIGKGVRTAPRDAILADSVPAEHRGKAFGFHRAMDHSGAIVGPLVATGLLALLNNDMRRVFLISAVPGILTVILLFTGLREKERTETKKSPPLNLMVAWRATPARMKFFMAILMVFTLGNSSDAFLLLKAKNLGVSVSLIPALWSFIHVVKAATSVPGGWLSDKIGRRPLLIAGWVVYAATYAGFAIAKTSFSVWILFAVYGVFFGLTEGVEKALVSDFAPAEMRGSAFGLYNLTLGAGGFFASILFGGLWQRFGDVAAFGVGAGLALLASILLLLFHPSTKPQLIKEAKND